MATTKSVSLFSVPDGAPLISEALPELGNPSPGQPGRDATPTAIFTMPTGLLFARGASRLFEAAHPSDLDGSPTGGSSPAKLVEQVVYPGT